MMTKTPKADTNINSVDTKKKDNHCVGNLSDLESPLKVAKSHYESSFVDDGTLSPTHQQEMDGFSSNKKRKDSSRMDQLMDRISLNPANKRTSIGALKGPYDNISDEEQKSPIIEKPKERADSFLPPIAARQNAHLRDFKYTPTNIEDYLANQGNKHQAAQHLMMDFSCSNPNSHKVSIRPVPKPTIPKVVEMKQWSGTEDSHTGPVFKQN
jgi:hypothetical protein|tara:strand:+ start:1566 stop:2198 length:633 start_codon:yes stop_codon:yes gene_type:complete